MGIERTSDMSTAQHCPMGESCLGCEYGECCAHQALQAERLRAEVSDLSAQLAAQREETATACAEVRTLRAEVERLTRERDEALSGECAAASEARAYESERDSARAALVDARATAMEEAAKLCRDMDDAGAIRAAKEKKA